MQVIAGKAKGTKLDSVPGDSTRPILDRVKTALFDILRPSIENIQILDLFAGSGSVGIEALSQGAAHACFLDINQKAIETINKNLKRTKLDTLAEVHKLDAFTYLKKCTGSFDLIYIAPPQYRAIWIEALQVIDQKPALVSPNGKVIVQIDPKEYEPIELNSLKESRQKKYGNTILVFYTQ